MNSLTNKCIGLPSHSWGAHYTRCKVSLDRRSRPMSILGSSCRRTVFLTIPRTTTWIKKCWWCWGIWLLLRKFRMKITLVVRADRHCRLRRLARSSRRKKVFKRPDLLRWVWMGGRLQKRCLWFWLPKFWRFSSKWRGSLVKLKMCLLRWLIWVK